MLAWATSLGRNKLFRQFGVPYIAFCAACFVVSWLINGPVPRPEWAQRPPVKPYQPHLPPPRHPSITHLTALQKDKLLKLNYEGSQSPLHWGKARTDQALRELYRCLMDVTRACELTPRGKVVIAEASYFRWYLAGMADGEHIWAGSVLDALYALGYTVLISESAEETNRLYADLSGAVAVVIKTRDEVERCAKDEGRWGTCLESDRNTHGIPIWKIFSMYFFPTPAHPLGSAWTLSPEPYHYHQNMESEARYLGYSIEGACLANEMVPFEERPNRAWMLAKYEEYFTSQEMAWDAETFPRIAEAASAELTGGFVHRSDQSQLGHIDGVTNLGRKNRTEFVREMSLSKVLIGIGNPAISPTPYEALCLGIPFINPIRDLDKEHPEDRMRWWTQHNGLIELSPPYVYHVHDEEALTAAIKQAMVTPIERTILPRMREDAVRERVQKFIELDWWRRWQATVGGSWGELYGQGPEEVAERATAA